MREVLIKLSVDERDCKYYNNGICKNRLGNRDYECKEFGYCDKYVNKEEDK